MPSLAINKQARREHELLDKYEAGIVLSGPEVKSARLGHVKLQGTYITIARGELHLVGAHIGKYAPAGPQPSYEPTRTRKLLIHKKELLGLVGKIQQKGLTLVPLELYTAGRRIKISFALARGKKLHDKREDIKKRDLDREARQAMRIKG